jgi:hypothetical protein
MFAVGQAGKPDEVKARGSGISWFSSPASKVTGARLLSPWAASISLMPWMTPFRPVFLADAPVGVLF